MSKRLIFLTILVLGVWGVLIGANAFGQEKQGIPIIQDSFAARQMSPFDTWKIYLKAADTDGNMRNIFAVADQAGVGQYPLSITRIKNENQKELSGYVYLTTFGPSTSLLNYAELNLTIWVQDRSGNFSQPVTFPLSLNTTYNQEAPPQGKFKEQDLGPIMIRLHPVTESAGLWTHEP
jgi:hypothetical protein